MKEAGRLTASIYVMPLRCVNVFDRLTLQKCFWNLKHILQLLLVFLAKAYFGKCHMLYMTCSAACHFALPILDIQVYSCLFPCAPEQTKCGFCGRLGSWGAVPDSQCQVPREHHLTADITALML